jgi:hypothetical protein
MTDQPCLTDDEWTLVIDLLQREHDELPVEIHHCRVANYREDLQHRLAMVQELLNRLRIPAGV